MKFLKNVFRKKEHEMSDEEQEKFNSMMGATTSNSSLNPKELVSSLMSLEEINRVRNLLDSREKELESGGDFLVQEEIHNSNDLVFEQSGAQNSSAVGKVDVSQKVTDNDLNFETKEVHDIDNEVSLDDEIPMPLEEVDVPKPQEVPEIKEDLPKFEESKEIPVVEEKEVSLNDISVNETTSSKYMDETETEFKDKDFVEIKETPVENVQKSAFDMKSDVFLDEIKSIFGDENVFFKVENNSKFDVLKGKKVFHVGLRQKEGFNEIQGDVSAENAWFIAHIKQLSNLKEFKMIRSDNGIKDLVFDQGDFAFLVSFRATSLLSTQSEFDFKF